MVKVIVIHCLILLASFSLLASEEISISNPDKGKCESIRVSGLPILVCNRSEEQLNRLRKNESVLLYDPKGANTLYAFQNLAEKYGSDIASKLLKSNLDMESRLARSSIGLIAFGRNGCVLRYDSSSERFKSPCSQITYDLAGRAIVSTDSRLTWNLIFIPMEEKNSSVELVLDEQNFNFYPELYVDSFTEKEKIKLALNWGKVNILEQYLSKTNINEVLDETGNSAIHLSLVGNKENIIGTVNFLLKNGADINKPNKLGTTPLDLAKLTGSDILVELLVSRGAK